LTIVVALKINFTRIQAFWQWCGLACIGPSSLCLFLAGHR
jgi:hypothetical protein